MVFSGFSREYIKKNLVITIFVIAISIRTWFVASKGFIVIRLFVSPRVRVSTFPTISCVCVRVYMQARSQGDVRGVQTPPKMFKLLAKKPDGILMYILRAMKK